LPSDGDDDPEFPAETTGSRALKIQRAIMKEVDEYSRSELRAQYQRVADEASLRRLDELSHPDVDHSWMWSLSRHHGASLTNAQFIEAIRLRLGCAGPSEPIPCALCGGIFDSSGAHAHWCDIAEATRGHNAVPRDPVCCPEVRPQCRKGGRWADPTNSVKTSGHPYELH
jgi:hypothetical protein